jgi:hypothetical protein
MHVNVNQYQHINRQSKVEKKQRKRASSAGAVLENKSSERILKRDYVILEGNEEERAEQLETLAGRILRGRAPLGHFLDLRV